MFINNMLKKSMALIFVFSLALVLSMVKIEDVSAKDLEGHWAEKDMRKWIKEGLLSGYSDGTYKPESPITRAKLIVLINRSFGLHHAVPIF